METNENETVQVCSRPSQDCKKLGPYSTCTSEEDCPYKKLLSKYQS